MRLLYSKIGKIERSLTQRGFPEATILTHVEQKKLKSSSHKYSLIVQSQEHPVCFSPLLCGKNRIFALKIDGAILHFISN